MDASHWNFSISEKHNTVHIEKAKKNHQRNVFLLKYYEHCLKSDLK